MEELSYKGDQRRQFLDGTVENMLIDEYRTTLKSFTQNRVVSRVFFAALACFQTALSSNRQQLCVIVTAGFFSLFWLLHEYSIRHTISSLGKLMANAAEDRGEQEWMNAYINWRRIQWGWEQDKINFLQGLEAVVWFLLVLLISVLS